MTAITFIPADPTLHRAALLELSIEYMQWVVTEFCNITGATPQEILGMPVPDYVASVIHKVCGDPAPRGIFYLVELDGGLAAMGGLRRVRDGVAEVKRIYVRPAYRGKRLGESILERVVADARTFGYKTLVLDSAPFMQSAQRIYEQHGFVDREPYVEVEAPKELHPLLRFMEKSL